jgi:alcohol dehydrogenase (cytochrome c)
MPTATASPTASIASTANFSRRPRHVKDVNWTKGIDAKTGNPVDYDPNRDVQIYNEGTTTLVDKAPRKICPSITGGTNFWPVSYSQETGFLYIPAYEGCGTVTVDTSAHVKGSFNSFSGGTPGATGPITSSVTMLDPVSGEIKKRIEFPYPNASGVLSTAGGLVLTALLDGTIVALDDRTLEVLWRMNVGTGFNSAPMTYAVDGKQYIAISSGVCRVRPSGQAANALASIRRNPGLKTQSNATVLYVFGL